MKLNEFCLYAVQVSHSCILLHQEVFFLSLKPHSPQIKMCLTYWMFYQQYLLPLNCENVIWYSSSFCDIVLFCFLTVSSQQKLPWSIWTLDISLEKSASWSLTVWQWVKFFKCLFATLSSLNHTKEDKKGMKWSRNCLRGTIFLIYIPHPSLYCQKMTNCNSSAFFCVSAWPTALWCICLL